MTSPEIARILARAVSTSLGESPSKFQARLISDLERVQAIAAAPQTAGQLPPRLQTHLAALQQAMPRGEISDIIAPLISNLSWYLIYESATDWPALAGGMAAGQMIGRRGLWQSEDLLAGVMMMAPDLHYPLHQHAALELYFVLSGTVTVQHGRQAAPQRIGPGEWSITPPHQVHALQSGDQGCLIFYLWTDELTDENWWWEERDDGRWDRVCWRRQPDSSWCESHRELLTRAKADQAGDC